MTYKEKLRFLLIRGKITNKGGMWHFDRLPDSDCEIVHSTSNSKIMLVENLYELLNEEN